MSATRCGTVSRSLTSGGTGLATFSSPGQLLPPVQSPTLSGVPSVNKTAKLSSSHNRLIKKTGKAECKLCKEGRDTGLDRKKGGGWSKIQQQILNDIDMQIRKSAYEAPMQILPPDFIISKAGSRHRAQVFVQFDPGALKERGRPRTLFWNSFDASL